MTTQLSISSEGAYTYTPTSVRVTAPNTTLIYALTAKSAENWQVTGMLSTDTKQQVSGCTVAPDGNSVSAMDLNSQAETFNVTVQAQHRVSGQVIAIDPEVQNDPE
jgi:hypothetical protein